MTGIGTLVNVCAIILGGFLGLLFKGGLKQHYQDAVLRCLGLCTLFIGAAGGLSGLLSVSGTRLESGSSLGMILSLVLGTLVGEFFDFDGKMEHLGIWLKAKADKRGDSQFVQGFVTASLVVCVGAMAIVGSIQDGLAGDATTLYTKAVIDGIVVMVLASVYGKGVLFSALPVGVLQGAITLCAGLLAPVFSQPVIDNLSFLGSLLIFCVGVNLAFGTKFKVANMLPALVFGVVFTLVVPYLPL